MTNEFPSIQIVNTRQELRTLHLYYEATINKPTDIHVKPHRVGSQSMSPKAAKQCHGIMFTFSCSKLRLARASSFGLIRPVPKATKEQLCE